jgi:glutamine synthetase
MVHEADADERLAALRELGASVLRLAYPDLHGVARSKDVPLVELGPAERHGVGFCEAIMTVDLHHNVVSGFEHGFRDVAGRADLDTAAVLPWEPRVAWCLADLVRVPGGEPFELDVRDALRRVCSLYEDELGLHPVVGPEQEFYVLERDPQAPGGLRRMSSPHTPVYTSGLAADPTGLLAEALDAATALGLQPIAASHEYGHLQYEINLRHGDALDACDRAFRLKHVVKELAFRRGLCATYMGKPFTHDEGSGLHLHCSLRDADGRNGFDEPGAELGLSPLVLPFVAGVLAHAAGLSAVLNPTVNAYRRFEIEALVPTHGNWGHDNRLTLARVPAERGRAARVELRAADGSANVYLATAAVLAAGLDGIRRSLEPPAPLAGNPYEAPEEEWGEPLPGALGTALDALDGDEVLREALGPIVDTFLSIKRYELERWERHLHEVTAWELEEYAHHL